MYKQPTISIKSILPKRKLCRPVVRTFFGGRGSAERIDEHGFNVCIDIWLLMIHVVFIVSLVK